MRQITTIEEKPRLQWSRLFLLAADAAVMAGVQIPKIFNPT